MPLTVMPVVTSAAAGATLAAPVAVDGTNGNSFPNTGRELIEVTNGGGSALTVTFTVSGKYVAGGVQYSVANPTVSVPAAATKVIGPFDKGLYNDGSGSVEIQWSTGTTVTARVVSLGTG